MDNDHTASGIRGEKDNNVNVNSSDLFQLHVAEYEGIITRNTYWITLQFGCGMMLLVSSPLR